MKEVVMKDYKIVFVDSILPITDVERKIIGDFGCEVTQYNAITPEEILEVAADADAIMTVGGKFTRETIEGLTRCKVIARFGMGYDNVDIKAATEKGIVVTYVPVYCQEEVATLALTLMLASSRRLLRADNAVKGGNWKGSVKAVEGATSMRGKTAGLIGLGSIQKYLVRFLAPFGCELIAYDPYIDTAFCKEHSIKPVTKEELLQRADYIFLQVPLMDSTYHMIDRVELAMMKDGVVLVNTGRGALINQAELTLALKSGKVGAAGLDVLEFEPPNAEDEIFHMDNVITSGHIGAATAESIERLRAKATASIVDVLSGKKPEAVANREVLEKLDLK